jgi:hypothetical protein
VYRAAAFTMERRRVRRIRVGAVRHWRRTPHYFDARKTAMRTVGSLKLAHSPLGAKAKSLMGICTTIELCTSYSANCWGNPGNKPFPRQNAALNEIKGFGAGRPTKCAELP